jgi:DNA invertase Pin-like site-specific DNA recombinase
MDPRNTGGARQRRKIQDDEWARVQAYRAELQKKIDEIEATIKRDEDAARANSPSRGPAIFGYIRVSHQDSKDSGLGEEGQKRIIQRWANLIKEENDIEGDIRWFQEEDAVSAFKKSLIARDKGADMNMELRSGDHVIFAYLDRAFRNTEDCLSTLRMWKRRGIVVHFANLHINMNTPMGEMVVTIMAACAQMDSAMKSERIKEVFAGFPAMGRVGNGHAPIGFKLIGRKANGKFKGSCVVPNIEERRIMGEIVRVKQEYHWSFAKISAYIDRWTHRNTPLGRTPVLEKVKWTIARCSRAYDAELKLRSVGSAVPPEDGDGTD